ncbi:MAG TPA: cyclopropane-fatty-acyl-phospholipid synthase family protein [Alphaproteobacteria bacterium]|nr:cyclopropane-fatty-acyl-phospholipid synthase family protein [Alphaproteobacteria bacterium]
MFDRLLAHGIRHGRVTLIDHRGRAQTFGAGEPHVTLRVADAATDRALGLNPWLKVGEAYMDGKLTIEGGTLYDLIDIGMANAGPLQGVVWQKLVSGFLRVARWWHQHNPVGLARTHVAHHYDLSRRLFELFLDESMQYSCAYFPRPEATLAEAQQAKMRHIAGKLLLQPGQRVLDIGCGWGGLALYLAKQEDIEVVGVTLSKEQHEVAQSRAKAAGLAHKITFKLQDYRLETSEYDRIVSVGMFEHVGVKHYPEFFTQVERLLKPTGVALLHAIGRRDGPGFTNPWLRKYIFPGGYSPALSEVVPVVERTSLWITDIEVLRLHYAETLRCWRENFERNRAEIARLYDERFCRMWEFYLIGSELSFRHDYNMVFQMQMSRGIRNVPLTRDYMIDWERGRAAAMSSRAGPGKERAAE